MLSHLLLQMHLCATFQPQIIVIAYWTVLCARHLPHVQLVAANLVSVSFLEVKCDTLHL